MTLYCSEIRGVGPTAQSDQVRFLGFISQSACVTVVTAYCRWTADEWSCILSLFMPRGHGAEVLHHNRQGGRWLTCRNVFAVMDGHV